MLTEELLKDLDTFLNLGIAFFVLIFILLLATSILLIVYGSFSEREASKRIDKEELQAFVSEEIKRSKDKELTAKERALMNMESDIKYICEYIQDYKK